MTTPARRPRPSALIVLLLTGLAAAGCAGSAPTRPPGSLPAEQPSATGGTVDEPTPVATEGAEPTATDEPAAQASSVIYIVQEGDTRRSIAEEFGISRRQLAEANPGLEDGERLEPGDTLTIPLPAGDGEGDGEGEATGSPEATGTAP